MTTTAVQTPVELIQDLYAAFGRGDIPYLLARIAPDCQWVNPGGAGIPSAGVYAGPAGAGEFFAKMNASEQILRFEVQELFANGESVAARGVEEIRSTATGKTASTNWMMHFQVRDGMVTRFEGFYDTAAYVRAHAA